MNTGPPAKPPLLANRCSDAESYLKNDFTNIVFDSVLIATLNRSIRLLKVVVSLGCLRNTDNVIT